MRIISAERLSTTQRHLGLIVAAWLAYLAVLGSLQLLGYKSGFAVWPLGEDRNWISILLKGEGANAAGVFWQVNDRNPLSPYDSRVELVEPDRSDYISSYQSLATKAVELEFLEIWWQG